MIYPIKPPVPKSDQITQQINDITEEIEELDCTRSALLEELDTTSFNPKRLKIQDKLSKICWKLDDLQEKQLKLELQLNELFYK